MSCSDPRGGFLDGHGAAEGLDNDDNQYWDQSQMETLQFWTSPDYAILNHELINVQPPHQENISKAFQTGEALDNVLGDDDISLQLYFSRQAETAQFETSPEYALSKHLQPPHQDINLDRSCYLKNERAHHIGETSQIGTPPNHAVSNHGSMHVQPHQLAQQPAGALQFETPSHALSNPGSIHHPPQLAQQPGTSQPPNITNAADAAKREKIRESKRKSWVKKENERKENEKRLAKVTKENGVLLEANERLEKEVGEAKIKQKKDEQELSNIKEEVSRLYNMQKTKLRDRKLITRSMKRIRAEMAEGQERIRAEINEGQERIRAEMVKINEGQERRRAGQRDLKRIRPEMVGTNEAQERTRPGQRDLKRIRAETNEAQKRIRFRHCLKIQIAKAKSENNAALIKILRALIKGEAKHELKRAEHERGSKNKD